MKRFAVPLLTFAIGFAVCWLIKDSRSQEPPNLLGGKIAMRNQIESHPANALYRPYMITVDGIRTQISDPPEKQSDIWLFSLADGRILIAAVRED